MDDLIESLLQYSRVGRIDLDLHAIDLNAVLAYVLADPQPLLQMNAVEVQVPEALPVLRCDRIRVAEILSNLISNAVKYNDKADKQVVIGCDTTRDPPVIYVGDNGIGIAPKHFARIFQIFRRLHGRDAYGGGAGAGLTITRKAIEGIRALLVPGGGAPSCVSKEPGGDPSTTGGRGFSRWRFPAYPTEITGACTPDRLKPRPPV
ncbi:ATP-binding protein [uncultured Thiodictyon sp.]|uniref:sensor histidine kinase n=1 Tax=uncultured Thiodictyon sp. TaxID=1846217 RepID=UPI0025EC3B35|nr:ATP-binding protein [uncultured Thiodictyon sp.]